jgi:hypothetical protein
MEFLMAREIKETYSITVYDPEGCEQRIKLSELNNYLTKETKPGMDAVHAAAATGANDRYEVLEHKMLTAPMINDATAVRATFTIGLVGTAENLVLRAVATGEAGNLYTCRCLLGEEFSTQYASPNLIIDFPAGTTVYELIRQISRDIPEVFNDISFIYDASVADNEIEEATLDYFTGGSEGYELVSTAEEIDNACNLAPEYGTPYIADAEFGSITTDGKSLDFTSVAFGNNGMTITLVDPGVTTPAEVVTHTANSITVTLKYSAGITSTLTTVKTAIDNDVDAHAMVTVAITGDGGTTAIADVVVLAGGTDGTIANAGKIMYEDGMLWIATADCTRIDSRGWRQVAIAQPAQ